jgi:phage/plasmid-associated DNA primase
MFSVYDSYGNWLATFRDYQATYTFIISRQRYDWKIKQKQVTERQKKAVVFIEEILDVDFEGDINNYRQVSNFLNEYLEDAKELYIYNNSIILENCDILYKDYYE